MPSGHAYAKALRTVKTCVGSEWCRFGTQDSTQMGKDLERAMWRMYAPHKVKFAVSGCPRNCAEAGIKDVGIIGVDSGWEMYVAGNGGIKTEVAHFFVKLKTAAGGARIHRRLLPAVPRGRLVPGAHRALREPGRTRPCEEAHPRRCRRPQGAVGAAAVQPRRRARSRGSSSTRPRSTRASSARCRPPDHRRAIQLRQAGRGVREENGLRGRSFNTEPRSARRVTEDFKWIALRGPPSLRVAAFVLLRGAEDAESRRRVEPEFFCELCVLCAPAVKDGLVS